LSASPLALARQGVPLLFVFFLLLFSLASSRLPFLAIARTISGPSSSLHDR
jgi:hypothetical protein